LSVFKSQIERIQEIEHISAHYIGVTSQFFWQSRCNLAPTGQE
jgi:hypothetical protein